MIQGSVCNIYRVVSAGQQAISPKGVKFGKSIYDTIIESEIMILEE